MSTTTHPVAATERIPVEIHPSSAEASAAVAAEIAQLIRTKRAAGGNAVLGLATGSTPTGVYDELIRLHREEGLSFKGVKTFNLDEYVPMAPDALQSYRRFMDEHLFDHVDFDEGDTHVPDGLLPVEDTAAGCARYEEQIQEAGGLDLQLLGIGRTGHIGFNEPGSGKDSRTRLIWLDRLTRADAASDFFGAENVPRRAITMGVGTIMEAKRIVLMAWGEGKAPVVAAAVEGPETPAVAASYLQTHPNATFVLDEAASAGLTRTRCPWLVGSVDWTPRRQRSAAVWLAQRAGKPLLKLTDEDYNESGLQELVAEHGPAYDVNLRVFRELQRTITGWPGGKPSERRRAGDVQREGDDVFPKRILIFSPHPDDDVISMGGTLIRLVDQGHEVHVAYQVSGNIAVFDADAVRFADFYSELAGTRGSSQEGVLKEVVDEVDAKEPGAVDGELLKSIKQIIRRGECRAAARLCGLPTDRLHFLDLPFYETGKVRKKPLSREDVDLTAALLERIKPHQVYAAGDLSDPHGTHRVCLAAVMQACERLKDEDWFEQTAVWLYRGAWQEWLPEQVDMAVPLSPAELLKKRQAIFKHESQKDRAPYPGTDEREFWERAEERNRNTARLYDRLGLAEYEAIEAFVQWSPGQEIG
ncbi:glucosamine-6-phosphate deaminase [Phycisphaera mikurensis]|uniref:Putative glucosamine-6-phosphate deaminase n=1 Tax=Phycisphaera mikurensis (strain NBRC 102666 / KCTC 22515 / FYK2301M01) TaxID=1142394 RepID=I0IDV1_PHYMF|nr:glucosamine-6-phosphate deaminase [Phycisphaera mikurensis]MBB6441249.1 glucosamine-6-phosphate deaminase [Phycisphaera mikurensis]BAM03439.1 putative glucosamine-6-phosphate deaminase [Phycisphaera mikurensis NBRC 102666]